MKRFLTVLLGTIILIGIGLGFGAIREKKAVSAQSEAIRPIRTMTLVDGDTENIRRYFGTVQGGKRVDLSFRVAGPLKQIKVEKGASVKKGDLLALLDPRDFQTTLQQAQSAHTQAKAHYDDAQVNFKRYENLYKQKAVSKAQYDTSKTQVDVTRSTVNMAAAQVQAARDALKDTELRAPFSGIIAERMVENFQDVTAKQPIFSLQDISTLEIIFNIPDNDILLAPIPTHADFTTMTHETPFSLTARFDAIPDQVFPLKLKEFSSQADSMTNTYPVTATMPQQLNTRFLPGMAVTVEVDFMKKQGNPENGKYTVPATAILNKGPDKNFLWRYENGKTHFIPVQVIASHSGGFFEVSSPELHNGDVIATAGVYFLREGQKVRLGN